MHLPSDPKDLTWIDFLPGAPPPKKRGRKKGSKGGGRPRKHFHLYSNPGSSQDTREMAAPGGESDEDMDAEVEITRIVSNIDNIVRA